jgi:hypothetical protein
VKAGKPDRRAATTRLLGLHHVGRAYAIAREVWQFRARRLTADQIPGYRDAYNALGFSVPLDYLMRPDVHVYGLYLRRNPQLHGGFVIGYGEPWRAVEWPADTDEGNGFRDKARSTKISCEVGCVFMDRKLRSEVHRTQLWGAVIWFAQRAGGPILFSSHTEALWTRYRQVLGPVIAEYHGEVLVDGVTTHEHGAVFVVRHSGWKAYRRMLRVRAQLGRRQIGRR